LSWGKLSTGDGILYRVANASLTCYA